MEGIRPIRTSADYEQARKEQDRLGQPPEGSPEAQRLAVLSALLETYEREPPATEVAHGG